MAFGRIHTEVFKPTTIRHGFAAVGLILFNPNRVLLHLTHIRTPSPPGSCGSSISGSGSGSNSSMLSLPVQTPSNPRQL